MHSFLVALTYMAMVFAPCAVAQWGDYLMMPMNFRFGRAARRRRAQYWNVAMETTFAGSELAELTEYAFVPHAPLPAYAKAKTFAEVRTMAAPRPQSFEQAAARVAARLAQMVEAHQLANTGIMAESAEDAMLAQTFAAPALAAPAFAAPALAPRLKAPRAVASAKPAVRTASALAAARQALQRMDELARRSDPHAQHMYLLPDKHRLAETPPAAIAA